MDPHVQQEANRLLHQFVATARSAMTMRGYTMEGLARELGISEARLERAFSDPTHLTVSGMAAIYDVLEIRVNVLEEYLPRRGR